MKIDIVCSSGSPQGVIPEDIDDRGVGGAELALITTAEGFATAGHDVRIFNNPREPGTHNSVTYLPVGDWDKDYSDTLILFRTPFHGAKEFKGNRVFWSCDQFTIGDFAKDVFPLVDRVVTISPFHTKYFVYKYGLNEKRITTIGIGVRTWEYEVGVEKVPGRAIFCSVPERGLSHLRKIWEYLVRAHPELSLVITSDYRLWGSPTPMNEHHRMQWSGVPNVEFLGKVSRSDLVEQQLKAQWMLYPCIYDELFCVALAECQVAGVLPITSGAGALPTTNITGIVVPGDARDVNWLKKYADVVIATMNKANEVYNPASIKKVSSRIFDVKFTLLAWEEVLNEHHRNVH